MSFCDLIVDGDDVAVEQMLGIDNSLAFAIDKKTGGLPFHAAAKSGRNEIIKRLFLLNPHELDAEDEYGYTPLHLAAINGHASTIHLLVRLGSKMLDACVTDWSNYTPMHLAAMYGQCSALEMLVQLGSTSLDALGSSEETPFFLAVENSHLDAASTLFRLGSQAVDKSPNMDDDEGYTPLHSAAVHCDVNMVEALLKQMGSKATQTLDASGDVPAHKAVHTVCPSSLATVKLLWEADSEAFKIAGNYDKLAPFHLAVYACNIDVVKFFVDECEIDVDTLSGTEHTALTIAANQGDVELLTFLIQSGSQAIDTPSIYFDVDEGEPIPPVWQAYYAEQFEACKFLTALGANYLSNAIPIDDLRQFEEKIIDGLSEDERADHRYSVYFHKPLLTRLLEVKVHSVRLTSPPRINTH